MIAGIKEFFDRFIAPAAQAPGTDDERPLQVATAALLLEMMRMDDRIAVEERATIAAALAAQFGLEAGQIDALTALAEQEARAAHDYYQFTALINQRCDAGQKARIVENLWRVAMADGHLDAHELHLMRKLADLLHVGHADYVAAKQRARAATGLPPG
ncbi:MAG: TerB family tellurite resistance protein [Pseudomonadota bacterium]